MAIFIDAASGDDVNGDGSQARPFKTIGEYLRRNGEAQRARDEEWNRTHRIIGIAGTAEPIIQPDPAGEQP